MAVRRKRNASGLSPDQRAVLRGLVAHPKFELIPLNERDGGRRGAPARTPRSR